MGLQNFLAWISRNPLKSLNSPKEMQGNTRLISCIFLAFGLAWIPLGLAWRRLASRRRHDFPSPSGPAAQVARRARLALRENGLEETREPVRPGGRPVALVDQVLPDLDQRVHEPARRGDGVDRVAGERPVIGFVVADAVDVKVGLGGERLDERLRNAVVPIP